MSELYRAGAALGLAASLVVATSAIAQDATSPAAEPQWEAPTAAVTTGPELHPAEAIPQDAALQQQAQIQAGQDATLQASAPEAQTVAPQDAAAPAQPEEQKAAALVSDGVSGKPVADDAACPKITLDPSAQTFPKREDEYKATLEGLARDCANLGAETILKVGLVGEGERDDKKGPSWFNAPIRLAVKDANGADVETRKIKLKVKLASGVLKTSFDHVEENVSLPPVDGGYAGWTVVVGFDPKLSAASNDGPAASPARKARTTAVRRASRAAARAPVTPPTPTPAPAQQQAAAPANEASPATNFSRVSDWSKEKQTQDAVAAQKARMAQAKAQQQARPAQPQQTQARPAAAQPQQQRAAQQQPAQRVGPQASIAPVQQPTVPNGVAPGTTR